MSTNEIILAIADLKNDMNNRFNLVDKRLDQVDERFNLVDKSLDQVDGHLNQIDERLETLEYMMKEAFHDIGLVENRLSDHKHTFHSR